MDGSESRHIAPPATRARRISTRRLALVAGVWAALAGGALGVAALLDEPPDQPPTPPVSVAPDGLPLLRLYLDRDLPTEVTSLPTLAEQVTELQRLALETDDPARWSELATIAMRAGDLVAAQGAFSEALRIDPERLDARIGIAMSVGATGPDGLEQAAANLEQLTAANPDSQLAWFNRGMVAVYRSDAPTIATAFRRAIAIDDQSTLGRLAQRFLGAAPTPDEAP